MHVFFFTLTPLVVIGYGEGEMEVIGYGEGEMEVIGYGEGEMERAQPPRVKKK